MKFIRILFVVVFAFVVSMSPVLGDVGGGGSDAKPADPDFTKGVKAVEAKRWDEAAALFTRAMARDDKNADIQNYLGYVERNRGNMERAFRYYDRALTLNPEHRGAREYLGEAYLMTGNLAKAEEQLAALDKLCFFPCHEYSELKEKIAEYKKNKR